MTSADANRIADGLFAIAAALHRLGTADAATPMGAIEFLAKEVHDGAEAMQQGLHRLAEATENCGDRYGDELEGIKVVLETVREHGLLVLNDSN